MSELTLSYSFEVTARRTLTQEELEVLEKQIELFVTHMLKFSSDVAGASLLDIDPVELPG